MKRIVQGVGLLLVLILLGCGQAPESGNARNKVAEAERAAERQAKFQAALDAGKTALSAGQFSDSAKHFERAEELMPGDADVRILLDQANAAFTLFQEPFHGVHHKFARLPHAVLPEFIDDLAERFQRTRAVSYLQACALRHAADASRSESRQPVAAPTPRSVQHALLRTDRPPASPHGSALLIEDLQTTAVRSILP
jgi:hypothetical protein